MLRNIVNVLCTPRFTMSWSCMLTVLSAYLLRLENEQSAMHCLCSGVNFFCSCLLINEWSTKRGGGSRSNIPIRAQNLQKTRQKSFSNIFLNTIMREWLSGLALCLWSEVVRFDSCNFFENQLLGSAPTLLIVLHGLAWCARNSGLPPTSRLCRHPRRSEFPLANTATKTITFRESWLGTHLCYQS